MKNKIITNKKTGVSKEYNSAGQLVRQFTEVNGKLEGEEKWWFLPRVLFALINYKNGKKEGELRNWHTNGQISLLAIYKNGKMEGVCKLRDNYGQLTNRNFYKNNLQFGQQTIFKNH